jgi:hypothetical protein
MLPRRGLLAKQASSVLGCVQAAAVLVLLGHLHVRRHNARRAQLRNRIIVLLAFSEHGVPLHGLDFISRMQQLAAIA